MQGTKFSIDELDKFWHAHAEPEFAIDLDAIMATVVDDPMYEFHPLGFRIEGVAAVREMYARLLPVYMATVRRAELRCKSYGDDFIIAEYKFMIRQPGNVWLPAYRMGIMEFAEDGRVTSERDYFSPAQGDMVRDALRDDFVDVPGVTVI